MRVFVVDTYYPSFLRAHYARRPELAAQPYAVQLTALLEQFFGTADAYSHFLGELGHETVEVVANCAPLQLAWAREHGISERSLRRFSQASPGPIGRRLERYLLSRIAAAQIDAFEPDVVYVHDVWFPDGRHLAAMRRRGLLVVGQIASRPPTDRLLRRYQFLVSSLPRLVERFRKLGLDSEYLPLAFDDRVLPRLGSRLADGPEFDVTFVGGLDPAVHLLRTRLLEEVAPALQLAIWGYGVDAVPADAPHRRYFRGEAWGIDMYAILAGSRITLNGHEDVAEGDANNMRLFEATGVGTLLLTDERRNLGDLFEPGRDVVTYSGPGDLVEQVRFYLDHPDERMRIAAAGQARTLADHTYRRRMPQLVALLVARLG